MRGKRPNRLAATVEAVLEFGRRRAEELVARHVDAIRVLADELMRARGNELDGDEVEGILRRAGVRRAKAPDCSGYSATPQPVQERYFERRGGVDRATVNRDSDRRVAVFERRVDGFVL
jgi:hypothetical protein